jgi:HTH-type transcriptional regulator, global nitrogen regulator NrpRI
MSFTSQQTVERKILTILKVLGGLQKPAGSVVIAKLLKEHGVDLSERAIRYHLRLTDERGLTQLVTDRDGRVLTEKGHYEIERALVNDKIGFAISRIEQLAFRTTFDVQNRTGLVPVNVSLFHQDRFEEAKRLMLPVFEKGFCVSNLVVVAGEGEHIGTVQVTPGHIGLGTVCSIVINGSLLKAGVPMDSRFGGILQIRDYRPVRFTEVIHYNGCSLDPSEIFIKAKMTSVTETIKTGNGLILSNFREIPSICQPVTENVIAALKNCHLDGVFQIGEVSQAVCEINVDMNKIGIVLIGGLNPVAAAAEAGIESENHSMSTVVEYSRLVDFREIMK